MDGTDDDVAETEYTPFERKPDATPVRLIVHRMKPTPYSQLALFTTYSCHPFITDRDGDTLDLEADHRRDTEVEYGMGLNHLPSGRFPANAAWLAVQVLTHNLTPVGQRASRSGRATGDHQDPAETLLLYGRTAYPLGAQAHFASSPGLALG